MVFFTRVSLLDEHLAPRSRSRPPARPSFICPGKAEGHFRNAGLQNIFSSLVEKHLPFAEPHVPIAETLDAVFRGQARLTFSNTGIPWVVVSQDRIRHFRLLVTVE